MRLNQLLERLEYEVVQGSDAIEISTLINDSRKVEQGSVFVCISGAVSDGHRFADAPFSTTSSANRCPSASAELYQMDIDLQKKL